MEFLKNEELLKQHWEKKVKSAENDMWWNKELKQIIFCVVKYTLDSPDGYKYYWKDLRYEPNGFSSLKWGKTT